MHIDTSRQHAACVACVVLIALVVRAGVGIHSYSGKGLAPMFGDYEAQRHWMEITTGLPLHSWYWNTSDNDLLYWGLDYPPLTAYHSWLLGRIAGVINTTWIELKTSRGTESPEHKQFMRISVLITDLLTFIPACGIFFLWALPNVLTRKITQLSPFWALLLLLVQPGMCLIDHGHFQYNGASLGFFIASIAFLLKNHDIMGSIFFCFALLFKQMELYHSLPIFCYLLGKCLSSPSVYRCVLKLLFLGVTVCTTLGVVLLPFILSDGNPIDQIKQIGHRVFPVARGLYEDKVSNVWCSLSVLIKWQRFFSPSSQLSVCAASTLAISLPACLTLLPRTTDHLRRKLQLLYTLIITSLTFFLFSYQVHEKSILLVTVPVALLGSIEPYVSVMFGLTSTLSMWPLLAKDQLVLATVCLCLWFGLVGFSLIDRMDRQRRLLVSGVMAGYISLICLDSFVAPPTRWPFLFPLLISVYSCLQFLGMLVYFYWKLIRITRSLNTDVTRKS